MTSASGGNLHIDALRRRARDFDPATRDRLLAGALLPANAVLQAQRFRALFREQVLEAFRHHDLLIAPATPCAAPLLGQPTITVDGEEVPTRANIGLLTQPLSFIGLPIVRSEEHTSELQSLMRISYAVFCLKKKIIDKEIQKINTSIY